MTFTQVCALIFISVYFVGAGGYLTQGLWRDWWKSHRATHKTPARFTDAELAALREIARLDAEAAQR